MARVRVEGFTVSLDGYGAGPDQDLANPLGVGARSCTSGSFPPAPSSGPCSARTGAAPGWTMISRPAASATWAPGSWGATCSGRCGALAGRPVEGLVGRQPALPRARLRADPPCPGAHRDGGRHHLPLRHRWHPRGTGPGPRRGRRTGCAHRRRAGHGAAVPPRGLDRRTAHRHLAGAAGPGEPLWADLDLRALGYRCVSSVASDKATHVVLQRQGPAHA
jgi:hypothetical protein